MVKRQIRYYVKTDTGEQVSQRHRWTFAIVNQPEEIRRIKERIFKYLSPVADLNEHFETRVRNSLGLHFNAFSFSSDRGKVEYPDRIYDSRNFVLDRSLSIKRNEAMWEDYMGRLL